MQNNINFSQLNKQKRRKRLQKIISVFAAVSVFVTCYALIIPGITLTMENAPTYCGMEAHTHTDVCYDLNGNLVCGCTPHEHDMLCFTDLSRQAAYSCGFAYEHTHTEECYQNGVLACDLTEHTHTNTCMPQSPLQELKAESEGFSVTAVAPCGALPEGTVMQITDVLPVGDFGQSEGDELYGFKILFFNGMGQEVIPQRSVSFTAVCNSLLFDGERNLVKICKDSAKEHLVSAKVGTDGISFADSDVATYVMVCKHNPANDAQRKTLCATENGCTVQVEYGENAELPENTVLCVKEYASYSGIYKEYFEKAEDALTQEEVSGARVFDISLRHNGFEIEPKAPVNVTVTAQNPFAEDEENLRIVHFVNNRDAEVLKIAEMNEDATQLTYKQASFSAVVVTTVADTFSGSFTGTNEYTTVSNSILNNDAVLNQFDDANEWQIISGKYKGNTESQKIDKKEYIRGQKNVIPTGVENEFLIYLSLDISFKNIVTNFITGGAGIVFESNFTSGDLPLDKGQSLCQNAWDTGKSTSRLPACDTPRGKAVNPWTLVFSYEVDGKKQQVSVIRYTDNNSYANGGVAMYLGDAWYVVGQSGKADATTKTIPITLSSAAVEKVLKALSDVEIGTLEDSMGSSVGGQAFPLGEGIFATQIVASAVKGELVEGNASIEEDGKSINWAPKVSSLNPDAATEEGWFNNVAELLYKIKYVAPRSAGLSSGGTTVLNTENARVQTNESTKIAYKTTSTNGTESEDTLTLTSPVITSLLYELSFTKTDDKGNPLAGATFALYQSNGTEKTQVLQSDGTPITAVSQSDGSVTFAGLQSGTYYIKETQAPYLYLTDETEYGPYVLSYTNSIYNASRTSTLCEGLIGQGALEEALFNPAKPIVIQNTPSPAYELPHTGGEGSVLFYIIGLVLILSAAFPAFAVSRKRKSAVK